MESFSRLGNYFRNSWGNVRLARAAPPLVIFGLTALVDWEPGELARAGKLRALLLAAAFIAYPALRKALSAPVALFVSYMIFMWVMRGYSQHGMYHLVNVLAALLVAWWLASKRHVDFWLCVFGTGQAVFGIAQWLGWNAWGFGEDAFFKPTGYFGEETMMGAFLVACLAPALFTRRFWAVAPIAFCIWCTHSTMAVLSSGVVLLLWTWKEFGWRVPVALAVGGVAALSYVAVTYGDNSQFLSFNGRLGFWRFAWDEYITKRPVFGFGPGFWYPQAPVFPSPYLPPPGLLLTYLHNEFIEGFVEYGAAGMGIVAAGLIQYVRGFRLTWHHAVVAGLLVEACGNFVFHLPTTAVIFLTAWLLSVRKESVVLSLRG